MVKQGKRGTGCTTIDIALLLRLIRYAYPHTKSDIRPLVEVRHAWYAEHDDDLGSFSEFEFLEKLMPKRRGGDTEKPSVSGVPLEDQYSVPDKETWAQNGKLRLKNDTLYDLCVELPEWCNNFKGNDSDGGEAASGA